MSVDPIGAQCLRVLPGVEQGPIVVGPRHVAGRGRKQVREQLAGREVLEADGVEASSHGVLGEGDDLVAHTDVGRAHRREPVPLGQLVHIHHDLFRGLERALLADVDGVVLALFRLRVVVVAVVQDRHREIRLFDAAEDLLIQGLLEILRVRHDRLGVGVLRLQVGDHLRVVTLPEPEVVVGANMAVHFELMGNDLGDRWCDLGLLRRDWTRRDRRQREQTGERAGQNRNAWESL